MMHVYHMNYRKKVLETSHFLVNSSPSSSLVNGTSYELWDGTNPFLCHLRFFRCDAFAHVLEMKRRKLDSKDKCINIGYKDGLKGYKL